MDRWEPLETFPETEDWCQNLDVCFTKTLFAFTFPTSWHCACALCDPKKHKLRSLILSGRAWSDLKNHHSLLGAGVWAPTSPRAALVPWVTQGLGDGCSIPSLNNSDSWTHQKTHAAPSDSLPPERQSLSKKSFCANHSRSITHVCPFPAQTAPGIWVIFTAFPCTLIHPDRVNLQLYLISLQRWIKTELLLLAKRNGLKCNFHPLFYFIDNLNVADTSGWAGFWPSEGSEQ